MLRGAFVLSSVLTCEIHRALTLLDLDGYDKLSPFGFYIHGCIDGCVSNYKHVYIYIYYILYIYI